MNEEELILNNLGLAYMVANKYKNKVGYYYEFEDVLQICYEGLVRAAKNYDDSRGVAFSTYACNVMQNHISNVIKHIYR